MMKVTCISPYYHNIWEALGWGYIYSYCSRHYKGKLDIQFFHGNFDTEASILMEAKKSDIVAFSCTTPTYKWCKNMAGWIKALNEKTHIVLGGWHPTVLKEIEPNIDQIVIGEGETAFLEILNGNRNKIVYGRRLPFSELPWPDREFIKYNRQVDWCEATFKERIASIQSVRGCKMGCAMCGEKFMTGKHDVKHNPIRVRLAEDTVSEIQFLIEKFRIQRFKFVDPTWSISESYVESFCKEKIARNITVPWDAMVHAGIATEKSIEWMSKANCDVIMVGCESGNQSLLNDMKKGVTVDKIKRVFEWGRKYKLNRRAFFMIGMPNETMDTIRDTMDLISEIDPDVLGFTILAPYPGSDFYDKKRFKDVDWSKVDEYTNDIWSTKNFTNKQLKDIQKLLCLIYKDKLPWHQRFLMTGNEDVIKDEKWTHLLQRS